MNTKTIEIIIQRWSELNRHDYNPYDLSEKYGQVIEYKEGDLDTFSEDLVYKAGLVKLSVVPYYVKREDINELLSTNTNPVLLFYNNQGKSEPIFVYPDKKERLTQSRYVNGAWVDEPWAPALAEHLMEDEDVMGHTGILMLAAFPVKPSYSKDTKTSVDDPTPPRPVQRLFMLLGQEKKDIVYICIYALMVGAISLTLPLGIQSIVSMISGGMIFSSVVVLIAMVIIGVIVGGGLQIIQITLVEVLQRRIFAKAAFEFSFRIPRFSFEALQNTYPPELMNRFMDVLTIQKGLPKLFTDLLAAAMQIFFGLILLSFYHPFFVLFGITLVSLLVIIFRLTGPKGVESSLTESKYKYKIVNWFQELARNFIPFKMAGHTTLPIKKTDEYINNYLHYRKEHFSVLIGQFSYIIAFKAIITGGLLILGTLLVVDRQITLGQFVAAEIVIISILMAVEKIIINLDIVYDLITAVEKIGSVTDVKLERTTGYTESVCRHGEGLEIELKNVSYTYPGTKHQVIKNIDLEIKAGEKICLSGVKGAGKTTLIKLISGVLPSFEGSITFNKSSIRDIELASLRNLIGDNAINDTLFDGTIIDNISMGRVNISPSDVAEVLDALGMRHIIAALPEGLNTQALTSSVTLSKSAQFKLALARAVLAHPKIVFVGEMFSTFSIEEKKHLLNWLNDPKHKWTVVYISNHPLVQQSCERVLFMNDGHINPFHPHKP